MKKPILSVIVLSYNTNNLLRDCLISLKKVRREINFEVIVPDNGSQDGSPEMVEKEFPWVKNIIKIGENLGFAAGNNKAEPYVSGKYILFLNSDTLVYKNTLVKVVEYMEKNLNIGGLTCRVVLKNGKLDKDTRRSFITPWIGLTHLFLKLDRIFPKSKVFSKYWYGYIPEDEVHDIDAIQGAFFLTRKSILDDVGWFDEGYFLDGEDIDLSWKIKEKGYRNVYYPEVSILHLKGASKGKNKKVKNISIKEKIRYRIAGVNSMELFYRKRLWDKYPLIVNIIVIVGIRILKVLRIIKIITFG